MMKARTSQCPTDEYFFLPTSRIFLSTFRTNCQGGSDFAQTALHVTAVHFAHLQVQARKSLSEKGCFGVGLGVFCVRIVWRLNKAQGMGVIFWAK